MEMGAREQINALENGKGVQYLLESAYAIFKNPIFMMDSFYSLIAASKGPEELSYWKDLITTGTYSLEYRQILGKEGIYDLVAKAVKPLLIKKSENRKFGILAGPIFNRDKALVSTIVMYEYYSSFDTIDLEAFEALMKKITNEIRDYEYFAAMSRTFLIDAIRRLLDIHANSTLVNHSQAQILRNYFDQYLYVAVVYAERHSLLETVHQSRLEYFKSLLKINYKSFKSAVYEDYIVMLMGSKQKDCDKAMPLGRDYRLFEYNDLYVGVSDSFEDIYELRRYYDQAVAALKSGMESNRGQRVYIFTDEPRS